MEPKSERSNRFATSNLIQPYTARSQQNQPQRKKEISTKKYQAYNQNEDSWINFDLKSKEEKLISAPAQVIYGETYESEAEALRNIYTL